MKRRLGISCGGGQLILSETGFKISIPPPMACRARPFAGEPGREHAPPGGTPSLRLAADRMYSLLFPDMREDEGPLARLPDAKSRGEECAIRRSMRKNENH